MAQYNKQLRAFYKAQGLQGKHLRSALKYDRRRIREYSPSGEMRHIRHLLSLMHLFTWHETKEGGSYWAVRCAESIL